VAGSGFVPGLFFFSFFVFLSSLVYLFSLFPFPIHFHIGAFWFVVFHNNISPLPSKKWLLLLGSHVLWEPHYTVTSHEEAPIAVLQAHQGNPVPGGLWSCGSCLRKGEECSLYCSWPLAGPGTKSSPDLVDKMPPVLMWNYV